jgi:murein DD-endopeptidase MepM/ murein hydrolase activator NlpD
MSRRHPACLLVVGTLLALGCDGGSSPTNPQALRCFERANFGPPEASAYTLPYQVGERYRISQSYCFQGGGHRDQLAYDFSLPIGAHVLASRGGVVRAVRQDVADDGFAPNASIHNHVFVEHPDGTAAFYAHLMQNSVLVAVDDPVRRGQVIALSGNSGDTGGLPHLHFGVYRSWPPSEGQDVPVNFSNADGPLDERGGLVAGEFYTALPY